MLLTFQTLPAYRVAAFGDAQPLTSLLTEPGFLPRDVTAVFGGIPVDVLESLKQNFVLKQNRTLVCTPEEPRHMLLFKKRPDVIKACEK